MTEVPIRKIIFVDVDGVFNACDDYKVLTTPAFGMWTPWITDLNKVELFNGVLRQAPDTRMVISSTWRLHTKDIEDFCRRTRFDPALIHPDWRTDVEMKFNDDRKKEVEAWLAEHPEIEKYVVLDDLDWKFDKSVHVRTRQEVGLTYEHLRLAMQVLGYRLKHRHVLLPVKEKE